MQRREALVSDKREKESSSAQVPKPKQEKERKGSGEGKSGSSTSPERETTLVFVEAHRGRERGLRVRIDQRELGTFWSEELNLDTYHGKVGTVYQKVAQELMNVFDLKTQSFTSESVEAADCMWTFKK